MTIKAQKRQRMQEQEGPECVDCPDNATCKLFELYLQKCISREQELEGLRMQIRASRRQNYLHSMN